MRLLSRLLACATLAPILVWLGTLGLTLILAGPMGCRIDEGSSHPCIILGHDLGDTAYSLGMISAWGLFFLAPLSFTAGLLWGLTTMLRRLRRPRG
ncbi:hypothetical protein [Pseudodonghicola xiamenensis]|uniref:Uncharacterized protein n=1 Tax=Pseudodonghicola xiamenensis TaxID=337702 RepID=A0A8J3HC03_9RHOB|nr:hypothetical protein [Pseudodonghicola xiamenensis]GHH00020.1 hypothetical protein GCM10010961_36410 [Pseudodonghicola xiamenensis]